MERRTPQTWIPDGLSKEGRLQVRFQLGKGAIPQKMWLDHIPSRKSSKCKTKPGGGG